MSNPFYNSIAFTFRRRFHYVTRDENLLFFYLCYWLMQPYKLLKSGWHLSGPKAGIQPIKNSIYRRCYRSIRHMYLWIKWDIKDRKRCDLGYFDKKDGSA